jgi:hypothetical protein
VVSCDRRGPFLLPVGLCLRGPPVCGSNESVAEAGEQ